MNCCYMAVFYVLIVILMAGATWWLVKRLRDVALQRDMVDRPNERSSHTVPVPRVGGIPLFALSWLVMVVAYILLLSGGTIGPGWGGFLIGALLVGAVSLLEDVRELPRMLRFGVHSIAALLVIWPVMASGNVALPVIGEILPTPLLAVLLLVWIVGLTNAYNFMDGIDGIAGVQGVVAALGWTFVGIGLGSPILIYSGLLILAGCAGFLLHNWPPAKIFMGDVGSTFLGYSFASFAVLASLGDRSIPMDISILIGFLLVWPFVLDASFTFMRRAAKRENVFAAHRSHLYQRLATHYRGDRTCNHRRTSVLYGALAITGLIWAHFYFHIPNLPQWLGLLVVTLLFVLLIVHTSRVERAQRVLQK
jgi:UDP-N-acetylmuramyl pentapeptide phosphotransferase/UDP-N-acetylglucosamine-1-phosphate transferase